MNCKMFDPKTQKQASVDLIPKPVTENVISKGPSPRVESSIGPGSPNEEAL